MEWIHINIPLAFTTVAARSARGLSLSAAGSVVESSTKIEIKVMGNVLVVNSFFLGFWFVFDFQFYFFYFLNSGSELLLE